MSTLECKEHSRRQVLYFHFYRCPAAGQGNTRERLLLLLFALCALPHSALADNCGDLSDCYNTLRGALAATVGLGALAILLSMLLDFVPIVGTLKGAAEAITGRDLITGQKLEDWERLLGIVPLGGALIGAGIASSRILRHGDDVVDVGRALRQTGAGGFGDAADKAYDAIRASRTDVADIAARTGYKPKNIQKVKDHLFVDEHVLDRYRGDERIGRFDSDIEIAKAWERLRAGNFTHDDIKLLKHEIAERWYMQRHGPSYNAAHEAAQGRFPAPEF